MTPTKVTDPVALAKLAALLAPALADRKAAARKAKLEGQREPERRAA